MGNLLKIIALRSDENGFEPAPPYSKEYIISMIPKKAYNERREGTTQGRGWDMSTISIKGASDVKRATTKIILEHATRRVEEIWESGVREF